MAGTSTAVPFVNMCACLLIARPLNCLVGFTSNNYIGKLPLLLQQEHLFRSCPIFHPIFECNHVIFPWETPIAWNSRQVCLTWILALLLPGIALGAWMDRIFLSKFPSKLRVSSCVFFWHCWEWIWYMLYGIWYMLYGNIWDMIWLPLSRLFSLGYDIC